AARRFVVAALLLIAVVVGLNVATAMLEPTLLKTVSYAGRLTPDRVGWYLDANPTPDILFMGSSRVYYGLDSDAAQQQVASADGVSVRAMNLGIANGDIEVNYLILKNLITDARKPKVIVYGISDYELNSNLSRMTEQKPYFSQLLAMDDFAAYSGDSITDKSQFILERLLPLYRDHELIRDALTVAFDPESPSHGNYDTGLISGNRTPAQGGTVPEHSLTSAEIWDYAHQFAVSDLRPFQLNGVRLQRLNDFLDLAHQRGIDVVLVNLPASGFYRTAWDSPKTMQTYIDTVRDVAQQHNTPLIDLYADSGRYIPPDGFADGHHLNATGARIVTTMVTRSYLIDEFRRH
ncbi:MAG TPA: DUF1574 family protein, partial [Candidatus Sulfotelmatobacter sp.]|nr:DUF1574 family protein [Candidatus Sulfotelmatobacter sp.]